MAGKVQKEKAPEKKEQTEEEERATHEANKAHIDDVLGDIDEVLDAFTDTEAEEWVRNFVQKGGE
jgi:ubiquitin-like protein Pup